jgi:hypothetical protein
MRFIVSSVDEQCRRLNIVQPVNHAPRL